VTDEWQPKWYFGGDLVAFAIRVDRWR